jgi:pyruvate-formate lyase
MEKNIEKRELTPERWNALAAEIQNQKLSLSARAALRLKLLLEEEQIVRKDGEEIPGYRTIMKFPDIYKPGEKEGLEQGHYIHEQGRVCNISSDWEDSLKNGLLPQRKIAEANLQKNKGDPEFLRAAIVSIDAVIEYADRYGIKELSAAVRNGAKHFKDALQLFRILHLALWASNVYHNTVGRFDQYMYPYFKKDMDAGLLTHDSALKLLEEFFQSFNRDNDIYTGMQIGDNGQSMMLGGVDANGKNVINDLTYLRIDASLHNKMIDPKINLRVDKNTPLSLYEKCTEMTKQGLGFPQYSNDDVVIPALEAFGYAPEDARNYTVAACWEFIVPGVAMDIPNIGAISLAAAVDKCIRGHLSECASFQDLENLVKAELETEAEALEKKLRNLWIEPAPYQSVLMKDCVAKGQDISQGAKYNNYGIHGTGFADAVDQLAAVKKAVYDDKALSKEDFQKKLQESFKNDPDLLFWLRKKAPKLGRDVSSQALADFMIDAYADSWQGKKNERGGIFRPGTGSAMYYVWHAAELKDTLASGHKPEEPLSANFSPSLLLSDAGLLSVISSFSRPGLKRVCNGGPLTIELHDTVFRNADGISKVAQLVRSYVLLGGHQLQLNAISRETLLAAKKNPEKYGYLIVRVWGWSGHFVQLDNCYQDQIIARTSYKSV